MIFFLAVFLALMGTSKVHAASVTGWAWGGSDLDGVLNSGDETGLGWISMNSSNAGSVIPYSVNVPDPTCSGSDCNLSGNAWSENLGWITFDNSNGFLNGCPIPHGVHGCDAYREGSNIKGWARFVSIAQTNGASSGWIHLYDTSGNNLYGIDTTKMTGTGASKTYAWSFEHGSIDFSRSFLPPPGTCSGVNGGTYTTSVFNPFKQYGDPNGDGSITAADTLEIQRAAVAMPSLCFPITAATLAKCDVTGDGIINIQDALREIQLVNGTASSKLCNNGNQNTLTGLGPWSWKCGTTVCGAEVAVPGVCSAVNGGSYTAAAFDPIKQYGDPDGDGSITTLDRDQVLKAAVALPSICTLSTCDLNSDGSINIADALLELRMSIGTSPSKLCNSGVQSGPLGVGPWNWQCGTTSCGANLSVSGACSAAVNGLPVTTAAFDLLKPYGDPNGDGEVTTADATQSLNAAVGLPSSCTLATCDLDGNGTINVSDSLQELNMANGSVSTKLCASGTQTELTGTGPWSWKCGTMSCATTSAVPPTVTFRFDDGLINKTINLDTLSLPQTVKLTWTTTEIASCEGSSNNSLWRGTTPQVVPIQEVAGEPVVITAANPSAIFTLRCVGNNGEIVTKTADITTGCATKTCNDGVCNAIFGSTGSPTNATCIANATCSTDSECKARVGSDWLEVSP